MKVRALLVAGVLAVLGGAEAAQAIDGPRAVRHIRKGVSNDCQAHARYGLFCEDWGVTDCRKPSRVKVYCTAWEHLRRNGNWRECIFRVAAVENPRTGWVRIWGGVKRCYAEGGSQIS